MIRKMEMKVNFNNARRNACRAHDRLIKILNAHISGGSINSVIVDCDDLEDVLNDLRMSIGTIASVYEEGNDDFKDVFQELYPEEDDHMAFFNPEKE